MKISKKTRDLIAYLIGGTVVVVGTLLLVALANGWQYNFATGEITETGLMLMGSEPNGANITLNNKLLRQKTNYRYSSAPVGEYTIRFEKTGFRPWTSQTSVLPGEVTFVEHAWLLPNEIPLRPRYADLQISDAIQTRDRKRFVFVNSVANEAGPELVTTNDLQRPVEVVATNDQLSSAAGNTVVGVDSISFCDDNSQILVRTIFADSTSNWLVIPIGRGDSASIKNINKLFSTNPSLISWVPRSNNELTMTENGNLRRIQLRETKISDIIAKNIIYFDWSNEWLTYITQETLPESSVISQKVYIRELNASSSEEISTINAGQNFDIHYFRSLDRDYLALLNKDSKLLTLFTHIYRNRERRQEAVIGRNVSAITVSSNGRFLVHNANNQMVTIDFERFARYRHAASLEGLIRWSWMNDQHLAMTTDRGLKLIDYDGQNCEIIATDTLPTSPILFSENKSILTLTTNNSTQPTLRHFFLDPEKVLE